MTAVVFTVASPVSSCVSSCSHLRNPHTNRATSSSLLSSSSLFPSSRRYPCLSISPNKERKIRHDSCLVAACMLSPPQTRTTPPFIKLYVSGLSFRTTEESLRNAFKDFGQLVEVNLVMDRIANRPRGFAFLCYSTEEESKKAIEGMHGKFLDGRVIFVEVAKPRRELRDLKHTPRQ